MWCGSGLPTSDRGSRSARSAWGAVPGRGRRAAQLGRRILRIRRRDGSIVDVAENLVVAGKVVPPGPLRRACGARRDHASEAGEQLDRGHRDRRSGARGDRRPRLVGFESSWLGRWLLRASAGFTGRANSVLPLGDPDSAGRGARPASRWYADRGCRCGSRCRCPRARTWTAPWPSWAGPPATATTC